MKYLLVLFLTTFSIILSAQKDFSGLYTDLSYKVDDYIYIGVDSLVISSVEPYKLDKCRIKISDSHFSIDDGGMGFKSKKVLTSVTVVKEGLNIYSIKGPYGAKWNVIKASLNGSETIGVFHARLEKQPVLNYTLFSDKKMRQSEISNLLLEYLSIEHENIKNYTLIEVDKYEISDNPSVAKFIKKTIKR